MRAATRTRTAAIGRRTSERDRDEDCWAWVRRSSRGALSHVEPQVRRRARRRWPPTIAAPPTAIAEVAPLAPGEVPDRGDARRHLRQGEERSRRPGIAATARAPRRSGGGCCRGRAPTRPAGTPARPVPSRAPARRGPRSGSRTRSSTRVAYGRASAADEPAPAAAVVEGAEASIRVGSDGSTDHRRRSRSRAPP